MVYEHLLPKTDLFMVNRIPDFAKINSPTVRVLGSCPTKCLELVGFVAKTCFSHSTGRFKNPRAHWHLTAGLYCPFHSSWRRVSYGQPPRYEPLCAFSGAARVTAHPQRLLPCRIICIRGALIYGVKTLHVANYILNTYRNIIYRKKGIWKLILFC